MKLRNRIRDNSNPKYQEFEVTFLQPQAKVNIKNQSFQQRRESKLKASSSLHQILPQVKKRENTFQKSCFAEIEIIPEINIHQQFLKNREKNSVNLITEGNHSQIYNDLKQSKKTQQDSLIILQESKILPNKQQQQHLDSLQPNQIKKKQALKQLLDQKKILELSSNNQQTKKKQKVYYNKWYVPYEKRFFEQRQNQQNKYDEIFLRQEALKQDPQLIYNSIQDEKINFYEDPFDLIPSKDAIEHYELQSRRKKYKDLFRTNKILLEQLEKLDKSKFRIPKFLQNLELKKLE